MTFFERWGTLCIMLCSMALGAAIYGGWLQAQHEAEVSDLKRGYAANLAEARAADVKALQDAQARADALTLGLQNMQTTLTQKSKEVRDALATQTTGRACLRSGAVRVLNDAIASDAGTHLPTPTAGPAAADGAVATDSDIAQWANTAREKYAVCRIRLDALINFFPTENIHGR